MSKILGVSLTAVAIFASTSVLLARESNQRMQRDALYSSEYATPYAAYSPSVRPAMRSAPVQPFTWGEKQAFDRAGSDEARSM